jgi:hypothetical protein
VAILRFSSPVSGILANLTMTALRFYLARQPFVLPGHVEQPVAGFGNDLVFRPLPELSRLLAVVPHAFQFGPAGAR